MKNYILSLIFLLSVFTISAQCGISTVNGNSHLLNCNVSSVDLTTIPVVEFTIQVENSNNIMYLYPQLDETTFIGVNEFNDKLFNCNTFLLVGPSDGTLVSGYQEVIYRIEQGNLLENFNGSLYMSEAEVEISFNFSN